MFSAISDLAHLKGEVEAFIEKINTYAKIAPKLMVDMQYLALNSVGKYKDCGRLDIIEKKG